MGHTSHFYIDGAWVEPGGAQTRDVINPATEEVIARIAMGTAADVDRAVAAAKLAFPSYSQTSRDDRLSLLQSILQVYKKRWKDIAAAITSEMGAPASMSLQIQAAAGLGHIVKTIEVLKNFEFEQPLGSSYVTHEPVGVCAFITPWNWPINQITCKVLPALAAGCTSVLKPSEMAPLNALLLAEVLHDAGVPKGVFNLINGDGPSVGQALATHADVDMISITGSTRAGVQVAKLAADSVKRVQQELGGKSANLILADADLEAAITASVRLMLRNSGQNCNAPSRMYVQQDQYDAAVAIAKRVAESVKVGDPQDPTTEMGPLSSGIHYERVQTLIQAGIDEGARLVTGGSGRPEGLDRGFYARPTIFADVTPEMQIAREEIFGPVLAILRYCDEEEAVALANDSSYGLSGYVHSGDVDHARRIARRLRTGMVHLNGAELDLAAPFGGYKQSGNGREWGEFGFREFLEVKSIMGWQPA